MSSDNDDYMSSSFLEVKDDVRPGLTNSRSAKRKHEIEKKKEESHKVHRTKPRRQLEEEQRNAGMDCALTSDNKGFAMLQKMGYKPGMKLGKQAPNEGRPGLEEPIRVRIKADRKGLGQEEATRQKLLEREKSKTKIKVWKEKETTRLTQEYRERMRDKVLMKQFVTDLRRSQKTCEQLDSEDGVEEPIRPWFWYSTRTPTAESDDYDEEDDEALMDPEEQLAFIIDYLRGKYFYCIWCGTKFDDEDDLLSYCPGTEKNEHE